MTIDERIHLELEERFQRDLAVIPVPEEGRWVPRASPQPWGLAAQLAVWIPLAVAVLVIALLAGMQLRTRQVPAAGSALPLPSATSGPLASPVSDPGRAALALKAPAGAGAGWDLVYALSRRDTQSRWDTTIIRVDTRSGSTLEVGRIRGSSATPSVYVAPSGAVYAFDREQGYRFIATPGAPGGWSLTDTMENRGLDPVISMHFSGSRAYAANEDKLFDVSSFAAVRTIATVGGQILGELEDGRLLVASKDERGHRLVVRAVALDGRVLDLFTVPGGTGPAAGSTGTTVFTLREYDPGGVAIVGWDIRTANEISTQPVGTPNNLTFAVAHRAPGYLFTDPKAFFASGDYAGLVPLGARGAGGPNWGSDTLPRHRLPMFDTKLSWSPDDAYIAFSTAAQHAGVTNEVAPRTPAAEGVALYGTDKRAVFEAAPERGAVVRLAGWIAR